TDADGQKGTENPGEFIPDPVIPETPDPDPAFQVIDHGATISFENGVGPINFVVSDGVAVFTHGTEVVTVADISGKAIDLAAGQVLQAQAASLDGREVIGTGTVVVQGSVVESFDADIALSDKSEPGHWYPDRKAPAGFEAENGKLVHTVDADDAVGAEGASVFSATQGRKFDLPN